MNYRPEIDGLRALAVIPVIFYHAGFATFGGGFVGVDVFFVISGYLITSIIYDEMQRGRFSPAGFYERRIRRILPALFVVCLTCVPFAWFWMEPTQFIDFSQSLIAVNLFVSNIFFWREAGYFATASELKPLLHTWSLAVEEQFYVLFPLALLLLARLQRKALLVLSLIVALISLGAAQWASKAQPDSNFYLLPYRIWELEVGVILALGAGTWIKREGWLAEAISVCGLAMITVAVFWFDKSTPFPSVWALIPVLGTAFIIAASGPRNFVGRMLSLPPLVGIGLISYSAYLWHQPLFAFTRIRMFGDLSTINYLLLILLAFALAYVTWKLVEVPFRNRQGIHRRVVFSWASGISASLILFGVIGHVGQGLVWRHDNPAPMANLGARLDVNLGLADGCEGTTEVSAECRTGDAPEIIVWGDSFAMHLVDGILSSNPDADIVQMTSSGCGPIFDVAPLDPHKINEIWAQGCLRANAQVKRYILASQSVKYAVLGSLFFQYLNEDALVFHNGKVVPANPEFILERFRATLDFLIENKIRPVVFAPPPSNGNNVSECVVRRKWFNINAADCDIEKTIYERFQSRVIAFLKRVEQTHTVVWMSDFLCNQNTCKSEEDGLYLYRDGGHLSREGSRLVGEKMDFYTLITGQSD